jgi:hypothetical protein
MVESMVSERGRKEPIVLVPDVSGSCVDVREWTLSASMAEVEARDLDCGRWERPPPGIHVGVDIPDDMIPGAGWKKGGKPGLPPTFIACGKNGGVQAST